jgi:hypothetical protein
MSRGTPRSELEKIPDAKGELPDKIGMIFDREGASTWTKKKII